MKKSCITFLISTIIILVAVFSCGVFGGGNTDKTSNYFRLHIRANSDEVEEQAVKYEVRDEVVNYLTPIVANCNSKKQSMEEVAKSLREIESISNAVLKANGFDYTAHAEIRKESFPTRIYGDYTLENGVYDSLIIELGTGKGKNWWCVVYPPLCFAGNENIEVKYKSLIKEKIDAFFNK